MIAKKLGMCYTRDKGGIIMDTNFRENMKVTSKKEPESWVKSKRTPEERTALKHMTRDERRLLIQKNSEERER